MDRSAFEPLDVIHPVVYEHEEVSIEAFNAIRDLVYSQKGGGYMPEVNAFDRSWKSERGNFTTRLRNYIYKVWHVSTEHIAKQMGDIAAAGVVPAITYYIEFTKNLDWRAGEFGDAQSCFWKDRKKARVMLKEHQSMAVHFYQDAKGKVGYARSWLVFPEAEDSVLTGVYTNTKPINERPPVLFNGYGMQVIKQAQIVAKYLETSYEKCMLRVKGDSGGTLYVNYNIDAETNNDDGGVGFYLGKDLPKIYSINLDWDSEKKIECPKCGKKTAPGEFASTGLSNLPYERICYECYNKDYFNCYKCRKVHELKDARKAIVSDWSYASPANMCGDCYQKHTMTCIGCAKVYLQGMYLIKRTEDGDVCNNCVKFCRDCQSYVGPKHSCEASKKRKELSELLFLEKTRSYREKQIPLPKPRPLRGPNGRYMSRGQK